MAFGAFIDRAWVIGAIDLGVEEVVLHLIEHGTFPADTQVTWLEGGAPGRFVADPRVAIWQGETWVLHELYLPLRGRGVIGAVRYADGRFDEPVIAIDEPDVHLAYPTVVVDGDHLVCLPDASGRTGVPVYVGESPTSWTRAGHLQGVPALTDPTLARLDGEWLLLGLEPSGVDPRLRVFTAPDLLGRWRELRVRSLAPANCRRPAGPLVRLGDGRLVRPAQDGRTKYGRGIVFQEIEFDGRVFQERPLTAVVPPRSWPYRDGFHTLSGTTELTFIDACQFQRTPLAGPRRLRHRLAIR